MKPIVALSCLGAFATFSVAVKRQVIETSDRVPLAAFPVGGPMPDFTLAERNGKPITLSAMTSTKKVTLVNFWGTWCVPCRIEMSSFEKAYADTANRGLLILAIDEDDPRDMLDGYLKQHPLSFPILIDSSGKVASRFGIRAYPTSILLDHDGTIIRVVEGLDPYFAPSLSRLVKSADTRAVNVGTVELDRVAVRRK